MDGFRRRDILRSGAAFGAISFSGCSFYDHRELTAICLPNCGSIDHCPTETEPLRSDAEPLASIETLNQLLDSALSEFTYPNCEENNEIRRDEPVEGETWDEIESVFRELPHGDLLHEESVIRVVLTTGSEPGDQLP